MKLNIKLGNCVVIILMLTRDENRAELEEHANPSGSGFFISRIGGPRGSRQAQSFENLRGNSLGFEKRDLEEQTQLFHGSGDGGTREAHVGFWVLQRRSRRNRIEVGGREILWVHRFCVEPQSFPILLGHSNILLFATKDEVASVLLVDRLGVGKHPQLSFNSIRDA